MPPLLRRLRLFWTRYLVPASLERDPLFRATMAGLTHRGLRLAGAPAGAAIAPYLPSHPPPAPAGTGGTVPGPTPAAHAVPGTRGATGGPGGPPPGSAG